MIAPTSLAGIHVFFPDPWPKKRHHKRRLLQPGFVHELAVRLSPGGYLHVATDWEDYAQEMLATLSAEPLLANTAAGFAPRPAYRPLTKFEARGMKLGHGVWDLVFRAAAPAAARSVVHGVARPGEREISSVARATSREKCVRMLSRPPAGEPFPQRRIVVEPGDRLGKVFRGLGDQHVVAGRERHALDRRRRRHDRQAVAHRQVDLALDAGAVAQRRDRHPAAGEIRRRRPARSR